MDTDVEDCSCLSFYLFLSLSKVFMKFLGVRNSIRWIKTEVNKTDNLDRVIDSRYLVDTANIVKGIQVLNIGPNLFG